MFGPQHARTLSLPPFPCLRAVRTSLDESAPPHPALRLTSSACRLRSVLLGILLASEREVRAVCLAVSLWLRSSLAPDGPVSVHCFRFYPLHWALLRDNSCARQLHVFCFCGSSQQIFWNSAEDFLCPSQKAAARFGSSIHSLPGAPITRAETEQKSCTST